MKTPIRTHVLAIALAALVSASLSAAPSKFTIGFDTDGNLEGFTGTNVAASPAMTTTGGILFGTASSGDPRLVYDSSTPIFTKPAAATWQTLVFRVRETADPLTPGTVVNTFDATGLVVVLNSTNGTTGASTIGSASITAGAIDGDGYLTVTAAISGASPAFTANDIRYLRVDPIGGTDAANNKFEVDFIEINLSDTPPAPSYFHPIPATAKAPLDGALFIAFDETVFKGTGELVIRKADNTMIETINVASTNVSVSGNRVTITPAVGLAYGTSYYVLIDSGAFTDNSANAYTGINDSSVWTFSTMANDPKVLFGDSFNRNDGTNPNTSAIGKYGSLGALAYTSRLIGVANVELSSGQLLLESNEGPGNSGAMVYLDHNFTDAAISTAGGFSITVDLNAYVSGGTTRYLGVAVGQTSTELDGQTTASIASATVADLAVGYRGTNSTLEIRKNGGAPIVTSGLPAAPTKMRIDYSLSNFNSGSTVNYGVFFDDSVTAFTTGSFTWSGPNENYISLSSNLILTSEPGERHALFDNLQVRTLGSGFDTWKATNSATGQDLDDDHDGDGVSNGIEYFIGGPNGITTGFTGLPGVTPSGGNHNVTFIKDDDYTGSYGLGGFEVQISPSLAQGSWSAAPISLNPNIPGTVHIIGNNVTYTFPADTKSFARLKVAGP